MSGIRTMSAMASTSRAASMTDAGVIALFPLSLALSSPSPPSCAARMGRRRRCCYAAKETGRLRRRSRAEIDERHGEFLWLFICWQMAAKRPNNRPPRLASNSPRAQCLLSGAGHDGSIVRGWSGKRTFEVCSQQGFLGIQSDTECTPPSIEDGACASPDIGNRKVSANSTFILVDEHFSGAIETQYIASSHPVFMNSIS